MSTYFKEKIKYISDDLMLESFDVRPALNELKTTLQDEKSPYYWKKIHELKVQLHIHNPDYYLLNKYYEQGKFRSHEFSAIVDKVKDSVKSAINILANNLDYTINQYPLFKYSIKFRRSESFKKGLGNKSKCIDTIDMKFDLTRLELNDVIAFLKWWNLNDFALSKQISITVEGKKIGSINYEIISQFKLERKPFSDVSQSISAKDLDKTSQLLGHQSYFQILKSYMFPDGFENQAEITLDIAKDGVVPQKRRTISLDGSKMKFHQLITRNFPFEHYQRIINENDIVGVYCSVKSTNNDLLYFLIDIDVSSFFYNLFPPQIVWKLTLIIAKSISQTATSFGLPPFKVSFSGAKGLHLLLGIENPKVIQDVEQYVNLSELYGYSSLPGMNALKKEKISSLNNSFKFAKSLLQALLLYTVYKGDIKIPDEIKYKLRISHPYQLFRLSPDSKNRLAILLDCSSMSRGVFRLYSPHPLTKLVSIPISDKKTNKICEKYYDYDKVREEAKIESVIQKFQDGDIAIFQQKPNIITRKHLRELLHPDKLLPTFATLLRFGTIYSMMRSPMSFEFWYRFFELRCFYEYVRYQVEYYNEEDLENFCNIVEKMGKQLHIENKYDIIGMIRLHMNHEEVSFPLVKHWLHTLYYIEFFFNLKSEIFLKDHKTEMIELFQNEYEFNNYLKQGQELFNIAVYTLSSHVILEGETNLSKEQIESLNKFYTQASSLIDLARYYLSDLKHDSDSSDKEERLIRTLHFVSRLYSISVEFIKEFYKLINISKVLEK